MTTLGGVGRWWRCAGYWNSDGWHDVPPASGLCGSRTWPKGAVEGKRREESENGDGGVGEWQMVDGGCRRMAGGEAEQWREEGLRRSVKQKRQGLWVLSGK